MLKNTLIIGSFPGEINILSQKLPEKNIFICGVGNTEAGINLTRHLFANPEICRIIFIGSAGFYPNNLQTYSIGEIVYANHFISLEIAELFGINKTPDIMIKEYHTTMIPELENFLAKNKLKTGIVNAINSVTITDIPEKLFMKGPLKPEFENMESFGLASAACKAKLPFIALLALTNQVGKNGSLEWKNNWEKSSLKLQNLLFDFLSFSG